ncbi:MAG TPA: matrixin family metalloprotease [Gemmatimonadaceae bacterium]|nr:matrixin family metalloprotease [Gemmatimonadaceae bacterium]
MHTNRSALLTTTAARRAAAICCLIPLAACAAATTGTAGSPRGSGVTVALSVHGAHAGAAAATTTAIVGPVLWTASHRDTLALWIDSTGATSGWSPQLVGMVTEAADAWRAAGSPLRFVRVADPASADVRVHWRRWDPGPSRGSTTWALNERGELVGADVTIVLSPGVRFAVSRPCELRAIALHELGHALGLPHDPSRDAVMYWQTGAAPTLTEHDRAALRTAYGSVMARSTHS